MVVKRTFNIVLVTSTKPGKRKFEETPDKDIIYDGTEQKIDPPNF